MTTFPFKTGDRVRLTKIAGDHPVLVNRHVPAGSTGTFASYDEAQAIAMVKLDDHYEELDEWNNEIEICDWNVLNNDEGDDRIQDQIELI